MTLRQDRHIHLTHLHYRFATPNDTARNTPGHDRPCISARTVHRCLKAVWLRCRRPYHGARLTPNHRHILVAWVLQSQASTDSWGGRSVMVWARFTHHHKTELVFLEYSQGCGHGFTTQCYIDQVLQPIVLPSLAAHPGTVLQQDNAWPHSAQLTENS